ncbi:uncharacterized protein LOC122374749 isoform X2 [Amphibalanus amphitrite]|uniref:uncharacterized protein LOC122374749 isoform X2 n=1 Tax=Amphibalanus amphitrite TaxID=1232801 RepID=UPI001C921337|nr:uncharacterized protein LOC122374749 isoform X2 [Amphibalanus amphitrite]
MMAARMGAIALRQKLHGVCQFRRSLSVINQRAGRPSAPPPGDGSTGRHPWDFKLSPMVAQLIITGSTLSFMLYFFVFRDESDVDTALYRPIWERVPGISPEVAERMLEVDRQMGILYDAKEWEASLREYKKRYYINHPDKRPATSVTPQA